MRFTITKIVAWVAMAVFSTGAHAVLTSYASLIILPTDAVATYGYNPANSTEEWYVSSDGPLPDSFFSMGGLKIKQSVDIQFAYLYQPNPYATSLILNGSTQSSIATFTFFSSPGSIKTVGTGISLLSASGDVASVDMSGLVMDWMIGGTPVPQHYQIPLGSGAWSSGYTNGVGNITCTAGSGCAPGSEFTLEYTATIPVGDPSGFGGVPYYLEFHGVYALPIPEASTYGMMLAGLGLVGLMTRCKRRTKV